MARLARTRTLVTQKEQPRKEAGVAPLFCFFRGILPRRRGKDTPLFVARKGETMQVGETYTGDELVEFLGGEDNVNDRLKALGNDQVRLILADEGNDNYKVLHIIKVN